MLASRDANYDILKVVRFWPAGAVSGLNWGEALKVVRCCRQLAAVCPWPLFHLTFNSSSQSLFGHCDCGYED